MNHQSIALEQTLIHCLENAAATGTRLQCATTESVDTGCESIDITVRFDKQRAATASLNLQLLVRELEQHSAVAALDLVATPEHQVVCMGAAGTRNYKICIHL